MKPAPVTPLVDELAAHTELGCPQAGYILYRPSPVGIAFGLLMACFWVSVGIGGLVFFGPALLQAFHNHTLAKGPGAGLLIALAGTALGCLLFGLYLFSGARRAFDRAQWYICPAGFIMVVNGKGEAVRWDQVEDFKWDTRPDNQHYGWMYRFRRSDGKVFWVYWHGDDSELYVNMGYEFWLAIQKARGSQPNRPPGSAPP